MRRTPARRSLKNGSTKSDPLMKQSTTPRSSARRLPSAVEQQINENLKLLYEQQLEQELPDRLKELVARLREGGAPK